jgi:hypothetical protein
VTRNSVISFDFERNPDHCLKKFQCKLSVLINALNIVLKNHVKMLDEQARFSDLYQKLSNRQKSGPAETYRNLFGQ